MKSLSWKTVVVSTGLFATTLAFADDKAAKVLSDLHRSNQMEIHMGKMAQEKGQSADVKAFGEKLVKDHTAADEDVLALAKKDNITLETAAQEGLMARHDAHEGKEMMEETAEKSGAAFDKKFAKEMIEDHKKDIAKVEKVAQNFEQEDVKALAQKMLPTLKEHLAIAQRLHGNLDK